MSSRVAYAATLLTLVLLLALIGSQCFSLTAASNVDARDTLESCCSIMANSMNKMVSDEDRVGAIKALPRRDGMGAGLYGGDGTLVYATQRESFAVIDMDGVSSAKTVVNQCRDSEGTQYLYAISRLEDGAFLLVYRRAATVLGTLGKRSPSYLLFMACAGLIVFFCTTFAVRRRQKVIDQFVGVINSFSEGDCDARIVPGPISHAEAAGYNAAIERLQDRLIRQRSRNHALSVVMNQMQNGIIAVDQNLRVMLITPVAKKLLGIVGSSEGMLVSDASNDVKLDDVLSEAMQQGGVYTNEVAARTTMGRGKRPLRLYVSPMRQDGKVVGALAMVEDITELRRLEQVRTDFAANVSHELKTPLTSIRGFVETLEAGAIDNPEMAHKFLKIIMLETERLTRLINDILSISKLESGDDAVSIERIRVDKVAFEVADMLRIHAAEKGVTIHAHMNTEPIYIDGNPDRVEQMLINLIENGIKYNRQDGALTVQVSSTEQSANISIADTGIGIAKENLPRLFERFYRVDKGRSRSMGGTGLGLAIVKHIVHSMNGEIEVQSKLGEGTEFLITLPLSKNAAAELGDEAAEE